MSILRLSLVNMGKCNIFWRAVSGCGWLWPFCWLCKGGASKWTSFWLVEGGCTFITAHCRNETRFFFFFFFAFPARAEKKFICNIIFLKKPPTRAPWKGIRPKLASTLKRICTWIHRSKPRKLLKMISLWGFPRILPTTWHCIQSIFNNLRETNYKISSRWLLFSLATKTLFLVKRKILLQ